MAEMNEKSAKKLLSIHIYEIPAPAGVDHEVEVEGSWGGMNVSFKTTIDKVREFFTQRREEPGKNPKKALKAVE